MATRRAAARTTLADLPIELVGNILAKTQAECCDRTPVCLALTCKTTYAAWKRHFAVLKAHDAEGRQTISWLATAYPSRAVRVLLENGVPDPAAVLGCLKEAAPQGVWIGRWVLRARVT
jgi:hypothetical protein